MISRRMAALALAVTALATPAHATPPPEEWAMARGLNTGRMSPGVHPTGCAMQSHVEFTVFGTIYTVGAARLPSRFGATFTGAGTICATLQADAGAGTMSGGINGNVTYVRTGHVVTLTGTVSVVGYGTRTLQGYCWWAGTFAPGTTFSPVCGMLLDA